MSEYIEREAAIDTVGKWLFSVFGIKETDRAATVFKKLRSLPAADVRPVVRKPVVGYEGLYFVSNDGEVTKEVSP